MNKIVQNDTSYLCYTVDVKKCSKDLSCTSSSFGVNMKKANPFYSTGAWKKLRQEALERDHYECTWCKQEGKVTKEQLEVDHILELNLHPEFALELSNLRTLCKTCHNKRHGRFVGMKSKPKTFRTQEWWG